MYFSLAKTMARTTEPHVFVDTDEFDLREIFSDIQFVSMDDRQQLQEIRGYIDSLKEQLRQAKVNHEILNN